ncbi:hypothetical protein GGC47_002068 [Bosea sp. OAE752]|uniref:DUF3859 domain-containing protein n=1 Tax=unclassified Bosea (in: a-proteobacteria) TaxID=2653178 RepID=UPI001151DE64
MSKRLYMAAMAAMILAAVSGSAVAAPKAEIVDFGVTVGRRMMAAPTPGGTGLEPAREMKNIRYLERADRIEARLCRNFGLTLKLSDAIPQILPRQVSVRVLHPQFTSPDGKTSTQDRFPSAVIEGVTHIGFTFDHEWEMEPGSWTFIVSAGGQEIARKDFTVTASPPGAPNSDCGVG